jgi:hypothetical protein
VLPWGLVLWVVKVYSTTGVALSINFTKKYFERDIADHEWEKNLIIKMRGSGGAIPTAGMQSHQSWWVLYPRSNSEAEWRFKPVRKILLKMAGTTGLEPAASAGTI